MLNKQEELAAQLERIQAMELRYQQAVVAVGNLRQAWEEYLKVEGELLQLENYYDSPTWQEDYETDEAGGLPARLARGVLSQDGLYDLLQGKDELIQEICKNLTLNR